MMSHGVRRRRLPPCDIIAVCVWWKNAILFLSGGADPLQTRRRPESLMQRGRLQAGRFISKLTDVACAETPAIFSASLTVPAQRGGLLQQKEPLSDNSVTCF